MPDAFAALQATLQRYGLPSLTEWAWTQVVDGKSEAEVMLSLYEQPAFQQRFPAIEARRAAGLNAITPAEYVAFEDQARQVMRAAGFPPSTFDQPDDFTNYLVNDVSLNELNQRAALYTQTVYDDPIEVRQALYDFYGVTDGDIAAWYADPAKALPVLKQKESAAQAAGAARRTGYGAITQTEAERLASLGITADAAQQGFTTLADAAELFTALPGEGADAIGREEQQGAVFGGDAAAKRKIAKRGEERVSQGSGAQSFGLGQKGVSGLGAEPG